MIIELTLNWKIYLIWTLIRYRKPLFILLLNQRLNSLGKRILKTIICLALRFNFLTVFKSNNLNNRWRKWLFLARQLISIRMWKHLFKKILIKMILFLIIKVFCMYNWYTKPNKRNSNYLKYSLEIIQTLENLENKSIKPWIDHTQSRILITIIIIMIIMNYIVL